MNIAIAIFVVIAVVLAGITQIEGVQTPFYFIAFCFGLLFGFSWKYGNENTAKNNVRTTSCAYQFTQKFLLAEEP
jgi:L-cystine uptake protein TcyP (sodium:dicarboxylate symporter family)